MARRFQFESKLGEHLDVVADSVVVVAAFIAFAITDMHTYWLPVLIIFMLVLFYTTSGGADLIKDSIGRFYGGILYVTAILTLLTTDSLWHWSIGVIITMYSIVVAWSRIDGRYLVGIEKQ